MNKTKDKAAWSRIGYAIQRWYDFIVYMKSFFFSVTKRMRLF